MLRQPHIGATRASPAQKMRGLRVALFQKLFQGYIFCFLGDSFGRYVFEQYARETNLKKKRSVRPLWGYNTYYNCNPYELSTKLALNRVNLSF